MARLLQGRRHEGSRVGKRPPWKKIRVAMAHLAHPGNFSRGLKTSWQ